MNLHLTRLHIPYDIVARPWKDGGFRDSYAWHKRVWECFPNMGDYNLGVLRKYPKGTTVAQQQQINLENPPPFLTRLDDTGGGFRLLILSATAPDKPDWCPDAGWETKSMGEDFLSRERYRFSLLANPTKKVASNAKGEIVKNGRRVHLSKREDLLAWLERKATQHGFTITPAEIRTIPRPRQSFLKGGKAGIHTATEFTGVLNVTDRDLFRAAVATGIGSAKAFGFGMLCLAPL